MEGINLIRATTPTHIFTFEQLNPSTFKVLNIYYAQRGNILLEKNKEDCTFSEETQEGHTIYKVQVTLTQEETKLFNSKYNTVEVQLRVLTADNKSFATKIYTFKIFDVLDDEELT